jgi:hypothetical protein
MIGPIPVKSISIDGETFIEIRLCDIRHMITPEVAKKLADDLTVSLWGLNIPAEKKQ